MYFINRAAIILRHKQAFVDWLDSTPGPPDYITLKGIHEHGDHVVNLIPQTKTEEEFEEILRDMAPGMLAAELAYFCDDEDAWPEKLDVATLREFFDVMTESCVVDTVPGPLKRERM